MSLLKAYERIERHETARSIGPSEWDSLESPNRPPTAGAGIPRDPLADLLATPNRKLTAPLAIASSVLGETIYLVASDHQAALVRARGGVPYTSEEVALLLELYQALSPEAWPMRLRLIQEAKRRFGGTVTDFTPALGGRGKMEGA